MPIAAAAEHRHPLVRRLVGVRGDCFRAEVEPRFDYAREPHETSSTGRGGLPPRA